MTCIRCLIIRYRVDRTQVWFVDQTWVRFVDRVDRPGPFCWPRWPSRSVSDLLTGPRSGPRSDLLTVSDWVDQFLFKITFLSCTFSELSFFSLSCSVLSFFLILIFITAISQIFLFRYVLFSDVPSSQMFPFQMYPFHEFPFLNWPFSFPFLISQFFRFSLFIIVIVQTVPLPTYHFSDSSFT